MALTKGVGFVNVRAFVTERYGTPAWRQLLEALAPADRELWVGLVPVGWYDLGAYARLIRAVDRLQGGGDLALVRDLGRFEAERDLTTIQRFFLKLVRPSMAIEQTGKYGRVHDSGQWEIERRGDRGCAGAHRLGRGRRALCSSSCPTWRARWSWWAARTCAWIIRVAG